jgi:hypothetical protein
VGNEIKCAMRIGKKRSEGKVLLETNELIFRGDTPLKIPFAKMKSVKALNGDLLVRVADEVIAFEVGEKAATKWLEKILHPKSRIEKLGVKRHARVCLLGEFDEEFVREVRGLTKNINTVEIPNDAEWIFFAPPSKKELASVAKHAKKLRGSAALWIVYPKGQKEITELDVLAAGRKAGLKDVKVVGFSPTHTALKFVIPVADR